MCPTPAARPAPMTCPPKASSVPRWPRGSDRGDGLAGGCEVGGCQESVYIEEGS